MCENQSVNYKITALESGISNVLGFYCDAVNVGMRSNKDQGDIAFIRSEAPCNMSALFTTNKFQAAPIKHFQKYPTNFKTNFLLINAKNANAMTGIKGIEDIDNILNALNKKFKVHNPIMSSTGVIGYRLPVDKIISAFNKFDFYANNSNKAARAIMTTDQFKKELAYRIDLEDGSSFTIAGICKGAGMIDPAMATMLCFIVTDADIPKEDMDELLKESADNSFNCISVDGDTSTNDTIMLLSNKLSGSYCKKAFSKVLQKITFEFAMMILRDGEGANKLITFEVRNAISKNDAKKIANALSNSLLVKTALFGEDPNWGRIASTIGASGAECDESKLKIYYDDLLVYSNKQRELDKSREDQACQIMKLNQFQITCDIGLGNDNYTAYGCDIGYEYIKLNAEYRT